MALFFPLSVFASGDISIGGNQSFNNNSGQININATNNISNSEFESQKRILDKKSAIGSKVFDSTLSGEERKLLAYSLEILSRAEKVNSQKITLAQKNTLCKKEAEVYLSLFGHNVNFGYEKCNEIFGK